MNVPDRLAEAEGARPPITDVVPGALLVSVAMVGPDALPPTVQLTLAVGVVWPPATASSSSSVRVIITSISGISGSFRVRCAGLALGLNTAADDEVCGPRPDRNRKYGYRGLWLWSIQKLKIIKNYGCMTVPLM